MDQLVVIQTLVTWLRSSLDEPRLQVKCDHVTAEKVVSAIYLEKKLRGEGRGNRLKELDVAIVDPTHKTVRLALEVDPVSEPFKPLGVFFSLMLADVYVPSGEYSPDGDYKIADCVAIYATVLSTKECSQKRRQFQQIEEMIKSKVVLSNYGLKAVHLCYGQDENEVVAGCQRVVRSYFKLKPGT